MSCEISEKVFKNMLGCGFRPGNAVVVAFSGGPDSLCLLEVLAGLVGSGRLDAKLVACHVDHMLRPCSGSDAQFARERAQALGIPFELRREDVASAAAQEGISVEDAARRVRYRLLEQAARSAGAQFIATGHNRDDQAETVMMRILRGAGPTGLAGIKASRPVSPGSDIRLVRPILEVSREQILSFLEAKGLDFVTDETNADTSYLRNRVRAELLPLLEQRYSPAARELLARLARSAQSVSEMLESVVEKEYSTVVLACSQDSVSLKLSELETCRDSLLYGILGKAFDSIGLPGILTEARFRMIARAVREGRTSGRLQPCGEASVEFQSGEMMITRLPFPQEPAEWEVGLQVPGATWVEGLGANVFCEIVDADSFDLAAFRNSKSSAEEALDLAAAGTALIVRAARPGDAFRPLGMNGTKKVSDFLTDCKVSLRSKARQAVVTADGKIAWLVGRRLDGRFAVTERTERVLLLSLVKEEDFGA